MNYEQQLQELRSDPVGIAQKNGYTIPDEIKNDPKAMVLHLINSGQVSNPVMQRIMPMIRQMMGK